MFVWIQKITREFVALCDFMWNDFLLVNIDWFVVIRLLYIYHLDVVFLSLLWTSVTLRLYFNTFSICIAASSSLLNPIWSKNFIGNSLLSFLIQSKQLIQVEFWSSNLRSSTRLLLKSIVILWLDKKNHSNESVNLSILTTLFLTHYLTTFSWLLSKWSTTWLSVMNGRISWHEWATSLFKNLTYIATHAVFWLASAASIV